MLKLLLSLAVASCAIVVYLNKIYGDPLDSQSKPEVITRRVKSLAKIDSVQMN